AMRLPIVMPVVNRALSGPLNIHCDHSDTMGARDSGWIQIFSENAQEAYDNTIQALRIAENSNVLLPVMVTMDGFIISHAMEVMEILEDEKVREFIGEYVPENPLLDVDNPVTIGPIDLQDWNFEHKRQQAEAMRNAKPVILEVAKDYAKLTGREYGLFEEYRMEDAEVAVVVLGSTAGTAKAVVDELRADGVRAGLLKIRVFRPFPAEEIAEALKDVKAVAVMDRSDSFNAVGGPVFGDVRSALYDVENGPRIVDYIYGIGGRDVTPDHIRTVYADLAKIADTGQVENLLTYLGVRE
ncbi:MAG TPA: pyruvate ferredoxin oxidoreductase, partial [Bacillota bacterium]|nr:pyruvate ferredoxin oxidoreductase [Bacillota bacterium]